MATIVGDACYSSIRPKCARNGTKLIRSHALYMRMGAVRLGCWTLQALGSERSIPYLPQPRIAKPGASEPQHAFRAAMRHAGTRF